MKSAVRVLLVCALTLLAGAHAPAQGDGATAPDGDVVLERYDLALANLEVSRSALAEDPASSREELDRAAGALRFLATQAQRPDLVESLERVIDRARTAVSNRSAADLGVQTALLQGGFQRALFDSAVLLWESEPEVARGRMDRLVSELQFSEEAAASVAAAGSLETLLPAFEAAVAEGVAAGLVQAQELTAAGHADAYPVLARAYADYLLIHDSPRADPRLGSSFAAAAEALVSHENETLQARLDALSGDFGAIAQAAAGSSQADEQPAAESASEEVPAATAEGQSDTALQGEAAPGGSAPGGFLAAAEQPAVMQQEPTQVAPEGIDTGAEAAREAPAVEGTESAAAQGDPAAPQPAAGTDVSPAEATSAQPVEAAPDAEELALEALAEELGAAGIAGTQAQNLARDLLEGGITDVETATRQLSASAAAYGNLLAAGDSAAAQAQLDRLARQYRSGAGRIAATLSPELHTQTLLLLDTIAASPAVRTVDAQALQAQMAELTALLEGRELSTVHYLNTTVTSAWIEWVRPIVTILVALLAILPLFLLNLAFGGGGNRNWRFVGTALFLVLVPLFFEGLVAALGLVSHFTGVAGLELLSAWSLLGSPLGQLIWTALTAAAVILLSAGFYGICVQFGLLRTRRAGRAGEAAAATGTTVLDTSVDWDEEF